MISAHPSVTPFIQRFPIDLNIEEGPAKQKLEELQQPVSPFRSARLQLLSYTFATIFAEALPGEKQEILRLAQTAQPIVEGAYTPFRRLTVRISILVRTILKHPLTLIIPAVFGAYKVGLIYSIIKPIACLVWQAEAIRIVSLAAYSIDWLITNQLKVWVYSFAPHIIPHASTKSFATRVFNLLLIPMSLVNQLSMLPITTAYKFLTVTYRSHQIMAESLIGENLAPTEAEDALRVWLDLTQTPRLNER